MPTTPVKCCFYAGTNPGEIIVTCVDSTESCPLFISHGGQVRPLVAESADPGVANCGECRNHKKALPGPAGFANVVDADQSEN
ncbi:hypothetical protein PH210_13165 [Paenibacillus sp. BSR1-1]|uniref:hypothetical protein n=1 Tax=Paenibacillus sp. BSR1-1 TaxID=3020845 RepID=UPI0025AFBE38|nr:hypothetical protein [Paenibacillus sp. BSR1-1]MDN3017143.1 hypothetical protein [Paenibacillus sp. BSR1-1]